MKKKGCNNEEELQALSKTNFLNVSCLKHAASEKLRKSLEKLNLGEIGADKINALLSDVDVPTLCNYVLADEYEAAKYEYGFLKNYSGSEISIKELLIWQKTFEKYMEVLDEEYENQKSKPPTKNLNQKDFSKYDEKLGEKYEQVLVMNYLE